MASVFLLTTLSLTLFSHVQADLVGDICAKSINADVCNNSLRSDPRTRGADLLTLGKITVDQSIGATSNTLNVATSLLSSPIKSKAGVCVNNCKSAIGTLNKVKGEFGGSPGPNLGTEISSAFEDINFCDTQFGRSEKVPPQLSTATLKAVVLVSTLSVIVKTL